MSLFFDNQRFLLLLCDCSTFLRFLMVIGGYMGKKGEGGGGGGLFCPPLFHDISMLSKQVVAQIKSLN
jgi:hypothetical protein